MQKTSAIVKLRNKKQLKEIIFNPPKERIIGRFILECTGYCGTYGQGGPGFFGLKLKHTEKYPGEWFILTLWSSYDWLTVGGQWVSAHPDQYHIQKPLHSDFMPPQKWDNFTPKINGNEIVSLEVNAKSMKLGIGEIIISLDEDPQMRPRYVGGGELREFYPKDDLHNAMIISPFPDVWV